MNTGLFEFRSGRLCCGGLPLEDLAAAFGTPLYVYSADSIRSAYLRLTRAFAPLQPTICYAVKANANLEILRILGGLGAGLDVVSVGELERAWLSGVPMASVVFAGTGKTEAEIRAALDGRFSPLRVASAERSSAGPDQRGAVGRFNVESHPELSRINRVAGDLGVRARVCLRLNPNVDAGTHRYITTGRHENKFGMELDLVGRILGESASYPNIEFRGVHMHLGSQITSAAPYAAAIPAALSVIDAGRAAGLPMDTLNIGGGFGVDYQGPLSGPGGQHPEGQPATAGHAGSPAAGTESFAATIVPLLEDRVRAGLRVLLEPGRVLVADSGVMLTRVQYVKRGSRKTFVICDAGMQTLLRPALYGAFHFVWPVVTPEAATPSTRAAEQPFDGLEPVEIVGPICESSDFLAHGRSLPPVAEAELLAVFSAGAYGMSMASTYNEHPRPAEVLIENGTARLIRRRQTVADLLREELDDSTPMSPAARPGGGRTAPEGLRQSE